MQVAINWFEYPGIVYVMIIKMWCACSLLQMLNSFTQWTIGQVLVVDQQNIKHHETLLDF